jgi:hypothetical protein
VFTTFTLHNYRGFGQFELTGLGRVNLLVGANNSGKTSILEAVGLLASGGDLLRLWTTMHSRGEWLFHERTRGHETGLALPYLFHGYRVDLDSVIRLDAQRADGEQSSLRLEIKDPPDQHPPEWRRPRPHHANDGDEAEIRSLRASLDVVMDDRVTQKLPVSEGWGVSWDDFLNLTRSRSSKSDKGTPVRIITTAAMAPDELVEIVDAIQLTDEEDHVLQALQIVEPRISQLRPTVTRVTRGHIFGFEPHRHGVLLKLEGHDTPLPIGTLGDGAWRILGLALALTAAKGGVLLVDEIDTGLHYTVMEKMWRLILDTATRLDVQVFATSHSRDCYESLSAIADPDAPEDRRITIQRIEPERGRAVSFTEQDIINAAQRGIEVR